MPGPNFPTRHKPDACSKITPSAKLEWIVASLQRQQGEQHSGWPPPSTPPPTPPGGGAGSDVDLSRIPSDCKQMVSLRLQEEVESKMDSENPCSTSTCGVNGSKCSADSVVDNTSESPPSVDYDLSSPCDRSIVPQENCLDKTSPQLCVKNKENTNEMIENCKRSPSPPSTIVCLTQSPSRIVPSSIRRIPKKRGLVLAEDKPKSLTNVDVGDVEASTSSSLASASDFLQKLVQEQKSQVPTLFCRSEEKTCSAKVLPNHVPNNADSDKISPGKTPFTFQYDSVSSDDEVETLTAKETSSIVTKERITPTKVVPSEHASGKLRFYLDGRFVLELTHAAASCSSNSTGWVQSKGKIWTPASEASENGATRMGISKPIVDPPCPLPQIRPIPSGEALTSVNSPFLLRISRAVRAIYLCWLTSKEIRKAARNSAVDASVLYQAALTRNSPIMGLARMDKNLSVGKCKRRRRPLHGIWKELFTRTRSPPCTAGSTASNEVMGCLSEAESKANHSLLLDALTKPKTRESSEESEANIGVSNCFLSTGTVSIPTECERFPCTSKTLTEKPSVDGFARAVKSDSSRGCKSSASSGSLGSKPEHTPILPLPEWYLDPSKAEVPISEMIGYPRPYFPPPAPSNNPSHIVRKRQQGSSPVPQFSPPNGKRVRLKQEQHLKECTSKDTNPHLMKMGGVKVESRITEWPSWQTKPDPEDSSSSVTAVPVSLVCSNRLTDAMCSQSSAATLDLATKVRNAKRFGSYGRGHAVNDAIRTFVIRDIVDLGGDLKTHYVPRGVYSEVASRYKIDVSTTTRWWLKHCAEKEHDKRLSSPISTVPIMKSDPHRPVHDRWDQDNARIKFEVMPDRRSPLPVHKLPWGSSITSPSRVVPSIISAHTRPMSEPSWSSGLSSRLTDQPDDAPYTISKRSSSAEKVGVVDAVEDGPLDLRVTSKRLRTVDESKKTFVGSAVPFRSPLSLSVAMQSPSVQFAKEGERMLHVNSPNSMHELYSDRDELDIDNYSSRERISIADSRLVSYEDRLNHSVVARNSISSPLQPLKSPVKVCQNGNISDRSTPSPSSDEVLDVGSHETNSPISSFNKSTVKIPKISPAIVSAEFPMLSSALKSSMPPSENSSLVKKSVIDESSSQGERIASTYSTCSDTIATNSEAYAGIGSKFGPRVYPPLPVPPLHSEYPSLAPTSAGLPPWPYPPCPLMAYGPALVNSYYYCCCFLPGCRFHYVYTADGRPVDPSEATSSPLVLPEGYSKCFSGVPDVSPLMYDSVRSEQVYKNWASPVSEPRTANASPSSPTPAREQEDKTQSEDALSAESTGSMLKDLLLKPSRATPERTQPLITSSKMPTEGEKAATQQHAGTLICNPVKVEKCASSHKDQIQRVLSPPSSSSHSLSKECSAKLSQPRVLSPLVVRRTQKDDAMRNDLSKAFWECNTISKSSCQPKHFSYQIGTMLETEES